MYGAILGDIIGEPYQWDNLKSKEFPLFTPYPNFTDDSVMAVAVAEALMMADKQGFLNDEKSTKILS